MKDILFYSRFFMVVFYTTCGAEPCENCPSKYINIEKSIELFSQALTSDIQHIVVAKAISKSEAAKKLKRDYIDLSEYDNLANKGYTFHFFEVTEPITGFSKFFLYAASSAWLSRTQPDTGSSDLNPAEGTSWLLIIKPTEVIANDHSIPSIELPDIYDGAIEVKDDNRLNVNIPSFIDDLKTIKNSMSKGIPKKLPELKTGLAEVILRKIIAQP